jgi:hypothetical protein
MNLRRLKIGIFPLFLMGVMGCNPLGSSSISQNFHPGISSIGSAASLLSVANNSLFADGITTTTITVTLLDSSLNPVSGKAVSLTSNRGAVDTITPATAISSTAGVATFSIKSIEIGPAIFTATDVTDSIQIVQTGTITFVTAAVFLGTDTLTQGTWQGVYGSDGYDISQSTSNLPGYAVVKIAGNSNYTWAATTADVRGLQVPLASRIAACWYNTVPFTIDINLTDNLQHTIEIYLLDWDMQSRVETLTVRDASTLALLNTQGASGFSGGTWFVWKFTGHVQITISLVSGVNAVVSGVFFN